MIRVMEGSQSNLIVVANRLPCQLAKQQHGWQIKPCSGGLVRALVPILQKQGGLWVGWDGLDQKLDDQALSALNESQQDAGYDLEAISLTAKERHDFYVGYANEIIWPLFHNFPTRCNFNPNYWRASIKVNHRFARAVVERCTENDFIWVHDYHLIDVGRQLRNMGVWSSIGFFLHIPFPPPDIFHTLPWREELLRSLLEYNLVGFQTKRDCHNFAECVKTLFNDVDVLEDGDILTLGVRINENRHNQPSQEQFRVVRIGAFPISINFNAFAEHAKATEVTQLRKRLCADLPERKILFSLERLDYTKGIPNKLRAFRCALERHESLHEKVTLIQCVVPSREDIPE